MPVVNSILQILQNSSSPLRFQTRINIYLEICDFGVTEFTPSVVTQLDVPLTGQVVHEIWVLLDDGIEDVLVGQAGRKHGDEVLLGDETPQLTPSQFAQPLQLKKNYPRVVP